VAAVDAPSFAAIEAYDPSTTITLSTVNHVPATGTQFSGTWLDVDDPAANTTVASAYASGGGVLSLQLDGGTLLPAHAYQLSVYFSDRALVDNAGFTTSTSESAFDLDTEVPFQTLGGDAGVDAGGDASAEASADGAVDGGRIADTGSPEAGPVDSGGTVDSSAADDAGAADSSVGDDGGFSASADAGGPAAQSGGGSKSGCSCRAAGRSSSDGQAAALVALGLVARRRRQRPRG
jgi:MYXO-CTERM domain-containing protein